MKKSFILPVILGLLALFIFYGDKLKAVFSPILAALILTYMAHPFCNLLSKRIPKILAAVLFYVIIFLFLALLIYFILPSTLSGIETILKKLPELSASFSSKFPFLTFSGNTLNSYLKGKASDIAAFLSGTLSFILSAAFSVVLSCFFLIDIASLKKGLTAFIPSALKEKLLPAVREIDQTFKSFFVGQFMVSVFLSAITFIILLVLKVDSALVLSIIYGLFCLIPTVGPFIGGVPIVAAAYLTSPTAALLAFVGILISQVLENTIISPKIKGESVDISPASAFIAIYLGSSFFGVFGMIFGVPVFASVKIILRRLFSLIT